MVTPAHTYNLGLKNTAGSWLPYAVAFGALPSVVSLAGPQPAPSPARVTAPAAALGVDRVFGRGTTPGEVASYLVHELVSNRTHPDPRGSHR